MNSNPLPETGTKAEFKRTVLGVLPPIPRYPLRPWYKSPSARLAILYCGGLGISNFIETIADIATDNCTYWTVFRSIACWVQLFLVYVVIRAHNRTERCIENSFYDIAEMLEVAMNGPDLPDVHLSQRNIQRLMANIIRRAIRPINNDARVRWYNRLHISKMKCQCCLQISHGYENNCQEILQERVLYRFSAEGCPFCGWHKF